MRTLELANSESFQQLRQDSWQWYTRVFQNQSMAFVTIQSQMMPLLTSKAEGQRFLELLSIYVRDSLYMSIGAKEQMIQKDKAATLQTIANQLSVQKWIELHEKTSKSVRKSAIKCRNTSGPRTMGINDSLVRKERWYDESSII